MPTRLFSVAFVCALLGFTPVSAVADMQAAASPASIDSIDLSELAAVSDPPLISHCAQRGHARGRGFR